VVTQLWSSCLPSVDEVTLRDATCQLRLRPDQIVRAAALAQRRAAGRGRPVEVSDVAMAARAQNSSKLERLARRISPTVGWDDLVLPPECLRLLHDLEIRFRRRDHVHGAWGLGGKNNRRLGVVSLFAGPSGVGKTMAAEALAGALGLDLYQVNLATVVDKYIGETEKNLERIFAAAEGVNGVILFDEADALFGKRSEVSDARDRYANVEVAYLLQRLESYEGVAVLATNLRSNIDDAFTRRLDVVVDFPEPEEDYRLVLWDRCLGRALPRDEDVDLTFLAQRFRLSGGNIRNIAVSAAFLASAHDRPVSMLDLVRSTSLEYRKLGRLCTAQEFGPWHRAVST
jgi:SpoVK/Ycf46/Vps4 family AAA+-type ATPase